MSYILDALKKNQAEQQQAGMTVGLSSPPPAQRAVNPWLVVVGIGLLLNAGVLTWYVLSDEPAVPATVALAPATAAQPAPVQQTLPSPQPPAPTPAPVPATGAQPAPVSTLPVRQPSPPPTQTAAVTRQPTQPAPARASPPPPSTANAEGEFVIGPSARGTAAATVVVASAPRVSLTALSPAEQARFDRLSYTSHIYTDDPTLCAVVIDGTRYQTGDSVEELRIVEITETGLVFEQEVAGAPRHVVVTPFE